MAYTRLEQEVPCILIEPIKPAVRIEGQMRQAVLDIPGLGEVFVENLNAAARAIAREAIETGSGKRVIARDVARSFVKATGVDNLLRTEAY